MFFSKLPSDMRRAIIIAAFGNRTLHIDLALDYPLIPPEQALPLHEGHRPNHAGIYTQKTDQKSSPPRGNKTWRWGSTVCHRDIPRKNNRMMRYKTGPWDDSCMEGGPTWGCTYHEGQPPYSCRLLAMGFVLSCKQAYAEGIDIIYGTNCISILSQPMLLHLPKLLLPQRLANIRSMELLVKGYNNTEEFRGTVANLTRLAPALNNISIHCRNLHSLFLSLEIPEYSDIDELMAGPMLPTIDAFYLSMDLREMVLEVPEHIYNSIRDRAVSVEPFHPLEPKQPEKGVYLWWCPWRSLEGVGSEGRRKPKPEIQVRTIGNYPRPPLQLPTPENTDKCIPSAGYWFKDGMPYAPPRRVICGYW